MTFSQVGDSTTFSFEFGELCPATAEVLTMHTFIQGDRR